MNIKVCDICYYQGKDKKPILKLANYMLSMKNAHTSLRLDACGEHKDFLKNQPKGKTIEEIETELFSERKLFYGGRK